MANNYQCKFLAMDADEKDADGKVTRAGDGSIPTFAVVNLATARTMAVVRSTPQQRDDYKGNPSGLADRLLREWLWSNDPEALWAGGTADFLQRERAVPLTTSIGVPVNDARLYARWAMAYFLRVVDTATKADDPALLDALVAWTEKHFDECQKEPKAVLPNPYGVVSIAVRIKGDTLRDLIGLYIVEAEAGGFIPAGSGSVGLATLTRSITDEQAANL